MHFQPTPMHLPDGFLSTLVALGLWAVSIVAVGFALRRVGRELDQRQVPLMGVLAAAVFAGQMLNFTVAGGTSGHLLGAALATILVGPWAAVVVLTTVVSIQALVFQDGGLLALGANLFNMAIIGTTVAYFVYTSIRKLAGERSWGLFLGGVAAAWASIVVAALACALELAVSGTSPANIAVPAMGGIHMLIGVGEALITLGALAFLYAARRDLFENNRMARSPGAPVYLFGLGIALLLAVISPIASSHPDGLEWVAAQNGFLEAARAPIYQLIPDYLFPGISNRSLATAVAGIVGTLLVLGVTMSVALLKRTPKEAA
ncbi:MAG: energy-coupling factor ABC transporter permease [Chloroflexi bacterium]|nr:energy-coupling factor ABC transporter permease [Chloroflexota bacterium]